MTRNETNHSESGVYQSKMTLLREMKFYYNIHKDRGLWSYTGRKQQEAESTEKILSCSLRRFFQVSLLSAKNVDDV